MPTRLRLGLLALAAFLLTGFLPSTCGLFSARLSGDQEVPPVETQASGAAFFFFTTDRDVGLARWPQPVIHYELGVQDLSKITRAELHCGPEGVNGPVAVLLFGLDPRGTGLHGLRTAGTITETDVLAVEDSATCPGGVASLADLAVKMKTRGAYVNVHSDAHPDGEIRGNLAETLRGLTRSIPCGPELRCNPRREICVRREPVGPGVVFACEPVPSGCRADRTCACAGAALCTGAFDVCRDVAEFNTISCECPKCQ